MKILKNIISFFVVLIVGTDLVSHFSYNIMVKNKVPKYILFLQHPYLSIKNGFASENKNVPN